LQGDVILRGFINSRESEEALLLKIRDIRGVKSVKKSFENRILRRKKMLKLKEKYNVINSISTYSGSHWRSPVVD
jgi:hypothetical protein